MLKEKDTVVFSACKQVRQEMVSKYGSGYLLSGHCIESSERIVELLHLNNVQATTIEGWCIYDVNDVYEIPYAAHTWVELKDKTYIDVTADQFSCVMHTDIPEIIMGDKPYYMVYEEPKLDEDGYLKRGDI